MTATITKHTVLDLEPANATWLVSVEREDYADPAEESGVLLSVGRTTVMLTLAEARTLAAGLRSAYTGGQMVALMTDLADAASGDDEEADAGLPSMADLAGSYRLPPGMSAEEYIRQGRDEDEADDPDPGPCERCGGAGRVFFELVDGPLAGPATFLCLDYNGTGWAA